MKTDFIMSRKKHNVLLSLLLAVMLLPLGCLGETAVTAGSSSDDLFDDEDYYAWLFSSEEYTVTDEDLALANRLILWEYNDEISDWCLQEAEKLPENSYMRKEYENLAVILQSPMPERPTE